MTGAVVFATEQGLGRQAKSFFDHGVFTEVLVWPHSHYVNHLEWYPNRVNSYDELLAKCDKILFFELPHDWKHVTRARECGVKTVLFAMYECTRYPFPYYPDVVAGGSILERETYKDIDVKVINVPAPDEIKWRLRHKARVFVHNAGHGGLGGRNGTRELLEAMEYVKSPIKLIVRSQFKLKEVNDPRIEYRIGDLPYESLFEEGDVFIYPDKFGGSCLPLQEAHSAGMCVMASNRHPTNTWLPTEPLIPIKGYKKERISIDFDAAIVDPKDIAKNIDLWYNKDIESFSLAGKEWAKLNSWKNLKPLYEAL
jgi:hypothetical protein